MLRISAPLELSPGGRRGSENSHPLVFCTPRNFQQTFQLISDNWSHQVPPPSSEKKHQTWQLPLSPDGRPSCSSKAVIITKPYPWVGHEWRMETAVYRHLWYAGQCGCLKALGDETRAWRLNWGWASSNMAAPRAWWKRKLQQNDFWSSTMPLQMSQEPETWMLS